MGAASINISELETLLDNIDTVDATLSQAETDIKNARDNTRSYSYQVPQMVPCTVGPHGRPSHQLCYRVEWYHPPHPHLTSFDLTAWNNWRDTWSPFYHRALGYGIDLLQISGAFGPGDDIPCGPDLDAQIAAATPALTPKEIPVVGAQIGVKIAKGNRLTVDEWLYWNRYAELPDFANAIMANCTVAQLSWAAFREITQYSQYYRDITAPLDLANLTDAEKAAMKAYDDHVGPMGRSLAVWASEPANQQTAISSIEELLRNNKSPERQIGMTVMLGYGVYATPVAVQIANDMYGLSASNPSATRFDAPPFTVDQYGQSVGDFITGVMNMLGNNPEASTAFFVDMSGAARVDLVLTAQAGDPSPVATMDVSARIKWAIDHIWPDEGQSAGRALANAGSPVPGQSLTYPQAQVGTQVLEYVASLKQGDHKYAPPVGLSRGIAVVVSSNMASLYHVSPYYDPDAPAGTYFPPAWASSFGVPGPDGAPILDVDATVFGTVIQAISQDSHSVNIVLAGWASFLPTYLGQNISSDPADIAQYLGEKEHFSTTTSAGISVNAASGSLAFIVNNALRGEGVGGSPEDGPSTKAWLKVAQAGVDVAIGLAGPEVGIPVTIGETAYDVLAGQAQRAAAWSAYQDSLSTQSRGVSFHDTLAQAYWQILAEKGYYDPSNPPFRTPDGKLDMTATATKDWLNDQVHQENAVHLIDDSKPGDAVDDEWVIRLPGDPS